MARSGGEMVRCGTKVRSSEILPLGSSRTTSICEMKEGGEEGELEADLAPSFS